MIKTGTVDSVGEFSLSQTSSVYVRLPVFLWAHVHLRHEPHPRSVKLSFHLQNLGYHQITLSDKRMKKHFVSLHNQRD